MFDRRLKLLMAITGLVALILAARLLQLQVVEAWYYRSRAERSLLSRPQRLSFVRGRILDRTGAWLVRDEACWDITIDFGAIAALVGDYRKPFLAQLRRWYPHASPAESSERAALIDRFEQDVERMWADLAALDPGAAGMGEGALRERVDQIHQRVARIRAAVAKRRGFDSPVAEENAAHAILMRLDNDAQILVRERFGRYPWLHVEASSVRRFAESSESLAHVLGRTGAVTAAVVAGDVQADDPLARYLANERVGISGMEYAAEAQLRGRRGQIQTDRDGRIVPEELVEPLDGQDVRLTVHAGLQRHLYDLLGRVVDRHPYASGGALVVLDVASREILALVSYPAYDPNDYGDVFDQLRDDTAALPLRFRAVANGYAPGSTIKPLVCLTGLSAGVITLETRETCVGYLFPRNRKSWRCWPVHGTGMRMQHGTINVVEALQGSCNIFMYRLGEKLGVDRLCDAFHSVGVGCDGGMGLKEEATGLNPRPAWLLEHRGTGITPGTARLFAMGQGEILMTPLQVANLMATYANGRYRQATLVSGARDKPEWILPAQPQHWQAVRLGMFKVVNDPSGTAYKAAHFAHPRYAICGKTGSATVHPRATSYRVAYLDTDGVASESVVFAGSQSEAIGRFERLHPKATFDPARIEVSSRWPVDLVPVGGGKHSHAWFGGFLQRLDADGAPDWTVAPRVAFAVLVEYGGSGGRTSGPLAKEVVATLLDLFGESLDWDAEGSRGSVGTEP